MKKEKYGKRLTRRTKVIKEDGDSDLDFITASFEAIGMKKKSLENGKIRYGQTLNDQLLQLKQSQEKFFLDKGLPHKSIVYQIPIRSCKTNKIKEYKWTSIKPNLSEEIRFEALSSYLIQEKGFKHDDEECLASYILERVDRLLSYQISKEEENKYLDAYKLGELIVKRNIYAAESERQRKNAEKSRSPLNLFISMLSNRIGTAKELWPSLIQMMENRNFEPTEIEKNNYPCINYYDIDNKLRTLSFRTFQNKLSKYKKNH